MVRVDESSRGLESAVQLPLFCSADFKEEASLLLSSLCGLGI